MKCLVVWFLAVQLLIHLAHPVLGIIDFILKSRDKLKGGNGDLCLFLESRKSIYRSIVDTELSICSHRYPDLEDSETPMIDGFRVHIPVTSVRYSMYSVLNTEMTYKSRENFNFPRFRNLKLESPKLPFEPYQRVMSYAIDVCYIPSIWYLELVHCAFIGMAPFFKGILMSYTLQDIVGAAIGTMGYLDESFSESSCIRSVSRVIDYNISDKSSEVCTRMTACLKSNHFSSEQFANLKEEFKTRIENKYSALGITSMSTEEVIKFARRSLLMALSSRKLNFVIPHNATERNFLVIRQLALSIFYLFSESFGTKSEPYLEFVSRSSEIVFRSVFESLKWLTGRKCQDFVASIVGSIGKEYDAMFREMCCKEIFSFGFIDENIKVIGEDIDAFNAAILPSRVLDLAYASVIPSYIQGYDEASGDISWLSFNSIEGFKDTFSVAKGGKSKLKSRYTKIGGITESSRDGVGAAVGRRTVLQKAVSAFSKRKKKNLTRIRSHVGDD